MHMHMHMHTHTHTHTTHTHTHTHTHGLSLSLSVWTSSWAAQGPSAWLRCGRGCPHKVATSAPPNTQALSPEALPAALAQLHAGLRPGGTLLLRDYGRLDLKHLKFAAVPGSRLPSPVAGWDWHTRGDGPAGELHVPCGRRHSSRPRPTPGCPGCTHGGLGPGLCSPDAPRTSQEPYIPLRSPQPPRAAVVSLAAAARLCRA